MQVLAGRAAGATVGEVRDQVWALIGPVAPSSIRSYLQINTPELFMRMERGQYLLNGFEGPTAAPDPMRW